MTKFFPACMFLFLAAAAGTLAKAGQEQRIRPSAVPPSVTAALNKQYPHATVSGWTKEREDSKLEYEASIVDGGSKREVSFDTEGAILSVEEAVKLSELPKAVKAVIQAKYSEAVLIKAEKVIQGDKIQYEVALKNAPRKEILVDPDGKIVKEE